MTKYTPYIVILILTYLVVGFIKMQFNPEYWRQDVRIQALGLTFCAMIIYTIAKFMINDMKK